MFVALENNDKSESAIIAVTHFISDLSPNFFFLSHEKRNLALAAKTKWSKDWRYNNSVWRRPHVNCAREMVVKLGPTPGFREF